VRPDALDLRNKRAQVVGSSALPERATTMPIAEARVALLLPPIDRRVIDSRPHHSEAANNLTTTPTMWCAHNPLLTGPAGSGRHGESYRAYVLLLC
jgi:hypothetical protein